MLKEDKELWKNLCLEENKYYELEMCLFNVIDDKFSINELIRAICLAIIISLVFYMRWNQGVTIIEAIIYIIGIFANTIICVSDIPKIFTYHKNKKELKQNNFDMKSLEDIKLVYSKVRQIKNDIIIEPLDQCLKRVCEYEEAILVLSDILQSDDFAGALQKNLDYDFVQEALKNEWNNYLQEISEIKPEDCHYLNRVAPKIEFEYEKKLKKSKTVST